MTSEAKPKKAPTSKRKLVQILTIVAAVILVLFIANYLNYKFGNRSVFLGTKDNYNQSQTLKFGDLNLKVNRIVSKPYPIPSPPETTDCSSLSNQSNISGANSLLSTNFGSPRFECESHLDYFHNLQSLNKNSNATTVYFSYSNISSRPLNLAVYKAKIIANTPSLTEANNGDFPALHPSCDGLPSSQLLKGSTLSSCFTFDIDKSYRGPVSLVVTNGGKTKTINLDMPSQ